MSANAKHSSRASPVEVTQELFDSYLVHIATGEPASTWHDMPGHPVKRTMLTYRNADPEREPLVEEARRDGMDRLAKKSLDIAAGTHRKNKDGVVVDDAVAVARDKLHAYQITQLISKWDPKRYGDRQQVEHSGAVTLEQIIGGTFPPQPVKAPEGE